jgi:hypothetical protein
MFNWKKGVAVACAALAVGAFATEQFYWHHLLNTSPTSTNPTTGQIYQLNEHGYFFYVTAAQRAVRIICLIVFAVAGLIAGVMNVRYKLFKNALDDAPKRFY